MAKKHLIVNADDFGRSSGVNQGVIEAHERGIVTSASLMVRWPAAEEAAAYARVHPELSVGLHLDIGEWTYRNEEWVALYEVVAKDDAMALREEIDAQVARFRALIGRGPTHLDSHQHFHRRDPACSIVLWLAQQMAIPVRGFCPDVTYSGEFYGQTERGYPYAEGITVNNLLRVIRSLTSSWTELGCHPGRAEDFESMYVVERAQEVASLCDIRVRDAIQEMAIELGSFEDFILRCEDRKQAWAT